jgi:hypothetical protein
MVLYLECIAADCRSRVDSRVADHPSTRSTRAAPASRDPTSNCARSAAGEAIRPLAGPTAALRQRFRAATGMHTGCASHSGSRIGTRTGCAGHSESPIGLRTSCAGHSGTRMACTHASAGHSEPQTLFRKPQYARDGLGSTHAGVRDPISSESALRRGRGVVRAYIRGLHHCLTEQVQHQ